MEIASMEASGHKACKKEGGKKRKLEGRACELNQHMHPSKGPKSD